MPSHNWDATNEDDELIVDIKTQDIDTLNTSLLEIIRELKKINVHLFHLTEERVDGRDL